MENNLTEDPNFKKKKKDTRTEYLQEIKTSEETNKSITTLNKLYQLNKNNPNKINNNLISIVSDPEILASAYHKLKTNQGSMTTGTDNTTADEITFEKFQEISNQIRNGTYKWGYIRTVLIPQRSSPEKRKDP